MASAKRIRYEDMNETQRKRANEWAHKWGSEPEKCPMLPSGLIVTNRKNVPHISDEDYNIITKFEVDSVYDITDAIREAYRKEMAELEADNLPRVSLR